MPTFVPLAKPMNKKAKIRSGMLAVGLLTALAIVVSQLFYFQAATHAKVKKETKTEQQEQQNGDDTYVSLPSTSSLPSSPHVELQQETFCLFEIILEDKESATHSADFGTPINQFFQTLFGAIISPNAP
jgi:hypothetical protein